MKVNIWHMLTLEVVSGPDKYLLEGSWLSSLDV